MSGSPNLKIDSQNGSAVDFSTTHETDGNLTYAIYSPSLQPETYYDNGYNTQNILESLKTTYLQFPGGKSSYTSSHSSFAAAISTLAGNPYNLTYTQK